MMNFVFDLDGTICFNGKPISEKIAQALDNLQMKGHTIIFASARPIRDMLPVLNYRFHNLTMIGCNGSLVSQEGKMKSFGSFSEAQFRSIESLILEYKATYLIDGEWDYTYTGPKDHYILNNLDSANLANKVSLDSHNSIVKILILTASDLNQLEYKLSTLDLVLHRHKDQNILDISPKGIHKGASLKLLIKSSDYIAFGNDANDVSMFQNAAYSVMIGHHDLLSKYATETISLEDDFEDKIVSKLHQLSK